MSATFTEPVEVVRDIATPQTPPVTKERRIHLLAELVTRKNRENRIYRMINRSLCQQLGDYERNTRRLRIAVVCLAFILICESVILVELLVNS